MRRQQNTVLIVDDDSGVQETLEAILLFEGYEVAIARDGIEALEWLDGKTPDLVLLDLMMPRMDGFTVVKELERLGRRSDIPIVVLTADGRAKEKAEQVGADGYVAKPFELTNLLEEIERVTRHAA